MDRPARGFLMLAAVVCGAVLASGCVRPEPPQEPTAAQVEDPDLVALWDAALSVLSRLELTPNRQDRANGVIETFPVTSQQVWEFWRRDVADPYSLAAANLQSIQRQATVRFLRADDGGPWRIDVRVEVTRIHVPERQMTATSAALGLYSAVLPTTEGLMLEQAGSRTAEPLGRDGAMERFILERILRVARAESTEPMPDADEPPGEGM